MAYDLEEQEQIDALKAWWKENGRLVLLALAAFVLSVAGVQGWRYYQAQQTREAAGAYQAVELALVPGDLTRALAEARSLRGSYPGSAYAPRAALAVARLAVDKKDLDAARTELQWAVENAKEESLRDTARLRLARVLLAQKRSDEALATLSGPVTPAFEALFADLRGDILQAQGKTAEARAAYQKALEQTAAENPFRALVELKRDALPGAKP
ncbi:MAG TPA: tetratricopeptide repeat protein [Pelomicrobium sp.]|nr:tetratricopeptide repeat protein [Pelomicrobium sp.]